MWIQNPAGLGARRGGWVVVKDLIQPEGFFWSSGSLGLLSSVAHIGLASRQGAALPGVKEDTAFGVSCGGRERGL